MKITLKARFFILRDNTTSKPLFAQNSWETDLFKWVMVSISIFGQKIINNKYEHMSWIFDLAAALSSTWIEKVYVVHHFWENKTIIFKKWSTTIRFTWNFVFLTLGSLLDAPSGSKSHKNFVFKKCIKIKIRRIPTLYFSLPLQKAMKKGDNWFWECQNGFKGGVL